MSKALKNTDSLAKINPLVNLITAPVVTDEMIAEGEKLMGPCPEHIRELLKGSNGPTADKVPADQSFQPVFDILEAMGSGSQITSDMVAAVEGLKGEKAPPEVLNAINQLNALHAAGYRGGEDQCNCSDCVAERLLLSDPNIFAKSPANFMSDDDESAIIEKATKDIMQQWERNPALSNSFPTILACAVLMAHSKQAVDANGEGRAILRTIDKVRQMISDNLGLEG